LIVVKCAQVANKQIIFEKVNKSWNGVKLQYVFDYEGTEHCMARITGTSNKDIGIFNFGKIEVGEKFVKFFMQWKFNKNIEIIKQ